MKFNWLRALLLAVALLALLLGAGAWLLVQGIDRGAVMARAVQEVKTATGRDFAVDGPVRLKLFPRIALVAEGVRLGNAPWGSRPDMARIAQLRFEVALGPLLSRRVEIGRVEISGADLLLETDAQGRGNWNFARADGGGETSASPRAAGLVHLNLAELAARDSQLTLRSGRNGRSENLGIEALTLAHHPDPARPDGFRQIDLDVVWRSQKLHAQGGVGLFGEATGGGRAMPVDLQLRMEGVSANLNGELGLGESAGQAKLGVEAKVQNVVPLRQMLGVALPLPVPASLRGRLAWRARELLIDEFELESQGQTVAGRIVWDRATTPPGLQLALRADGLDLARLYPAARHATPATDSARVFSDTPFPSFELPALAVQADLRVERLVLPNGLELATVKAAGTSRPDRIELAQLDFGLARGSFNVSGSWQPQVGARASAPPRVSMRLKARGVAMDALLALMRREAVISGGRTDADMRLSGAGSSPQQLAASLNGELRLRMGEASSVERQRAGGGPGDLLAALLHALTPLQAPEDSIKVRCAAARLPLRNGRIEVDRSIAVEGERVDLVMAGSIDLGNERIDLAMRPTVKKGTGLDPTAFAGVVKIAGTLAAPQVEMNLAGTAREAASIGAAVATSGATLLGERLLGMVSDPHPCESAYSGSAKTSPVDDAGKKVTAPLRKLFSR